ncbi:uncharacterized protein STEHIDRAFT_115529 [Stereum hirsutum FP-91666 SS1]|uniref:uncharacterized protein n=1 Tax=Stereum hirsutum (strain FP-91666) TaxID=721885 RepID=UPI0004449829|nr:uncharacterized protein STEHIDRAFT_115529 [Stereum hirsutum FP-91666 SS1]EIM80651.1 hypothetical protein STEHIDRAFT_115529 [Stereum hirsutum FP-91666 SS1]
MGWVSSLLNIVPKISLVCLALSATDVARAAIQVLSNTTLGPDPQTVNRLNGESFQQEALVTFNGYQYAAFWLADTSNSSVRHPSVSRRDLSADPSSPGEWDTFTFMDYNQTEDDGHDIMVIGVAPADGTVHLSFDHHDNELKYRVSQPGVASSPNSTNTTWSADLFGPIVNILPGLESLNETEFFGDVTYPRFLFSSPDPTNSSFILELRIGRSGLGDDWLYEYNAENQSWTMIGKYLEMIIADNAYINGIDFDNSGNLVTTWTYRDYVNDTGQDVAVQAGPNGPENNHDLMYAQSPDLGRTWFNTWGQPVANLSADLSLDNQTPILPTSAGVTVFSIPKYGGILNQEAQTIDEEGRIHVLNRENGTGYEQW